MAPTLVASYYVQSSGTSTAAVTTPSFTPTNGEVIVVKLETWDTAVAMGAPTGGSQTYTSRAIVAPGGFRPWAGIYTAVIAGSPGSMTVSSTPGASSRYSMVVERWTGQLAASPAVGTNNAGSGSANGTVTTTGTNSIVSWVASDAQSLDPATRAYLASATDEGVRDDHVGANGVAYHAYQTAAAAGSQSFGLSAPTGMQYCIAGIEVQDAAPAATDGGGYIEQAFWPGDGPNTTQRFVDNLWLSTEVTVTSTDTTIADAPSGVLTGTSPAATTIDVLTPDAPSGVRAAESPATVAVSVAIADTPAGVRAGASSAATTIDVLTADAPAGVRAGASSAATTIDVLTPDAPSGVRLAESPAAAGSSTFVSDTPSGVRAGASSATTTIDVLTPDVPSGARAGASSAATTIDVLTADTPSGIRAAESPGAAGSSTFASDAAPSGVRAGTSPAAVVLDVVTLDTPTGARLGLSTATAVFTSLLPDTPAGIRLGVSPAVVSSSADSTVSATAAAIRLGSSPATLRVQQIVTRPNTGTVTRPNTGTVTRPNTGTVTRPNTGTVARPNTGTVYRP
jgi:hypothetical protein